MGRGQSQELQQIGLGNTTSIDAFGRLRVSSPQTLFDSKQIFDNSPLYFDDQEVSGGGTSTSHSVATASTTISVSNTTAGKRARQTFQRFNYQPGKSQFILCTFTFGAGTDGISKCTGYYDDNNGIFVKQEGDTISFVLRSKTTGSVVDTEVAQSAWNMDRLDGSFGANNESKITLDVTKSQILFIDLEWLGVGRVRVGFVENGAFIVCHEFRNSNVVEGVYMSTPNLPIRYEIDNDGTGAADSFEHICSSVMSEGGTQELGTLRYASTGGTHVDAATENTIYAVIGIRLKSGYIGESVKLISTALQIHTASEQVEWILKVNPTVAGTFTYSDQTNSAVQIATGATANTVTGGTDIAGGFLESGGNQTGNSGSAGQGLENALLLGSAIDGTVDEIVLCIRPIAGSVDVDIEGSLTWRELT